jgi:GNAT superfamily N-acetyltransferase
MTGPTPEQLASIQIRDFCESDRVRTKMLIADFQDEEAKLATGYQAGTAVAEPHLNALLAHCRGLCGRLLVVDVLSELVGYVCFHLEEVTCVTHQYDVTVADLYLKPLWRGRGIGKQLLDWAKLYAQGVGVPRVTIRVLANNAPARAMYASVGYREHEVKLTLGLPPHYLAKVCVRPEKLRKSKDAP